MKKYSLGFAFDQKLEHVVLIEKTHPSFLAGKLNGLGGKLEDKDNGFLMRCHRREFFEECGLPTDDGSWRYFAKFFQRFGDFEVFCYYAILLDSMIESVCSMTEEKVAIYRVQDIPGLPVMPNLRWLIPMAISLERGETAERFIIEEIHKDE